MTCKVSVKIGAFLPWQADQCSTAPPAILRLAFTFVGPSALIPVVYEPEPALSHATAEANTQSLPRADAVPLQKLVVAPLLKLSQHCSSKQRSDEGSRTPGHTKGSQFTISVAAFSTAGYAPGYKDANQDSCFAFDTYLTPDQALFGVIDGHGFEGHFVSQYIKRHLPSAFLNRLITGATLEQAFTASFADVDSLLTTSGIDVVNSGSTAVVCFLKGKSLTTAWVGDSRAVLGSLQGQDWTVTELSNDHKPDRPDERQRIVAAGGRVAKEVARAGHPRGPYRVWLKDEDFPGLAMSRAFGDIPGRPIGLVSIPECSSTQLSGGNHVLVLASDGVWDHISSAEAIAIATDAPSASVACKRLVHKAHSKWVGEYGGQYIDDVSAVVVRLA